MGHAPQIWMCFILEISDKCKQSFTLRDLERKNNHFYILRTCRYKVLP